MINVIPIELDTMDISDLLIMKKICFYAFRGILFEIVAFPKSLSHEVSFVNHFWIYLFYTNFFISNYINIKGK